MGLRDNRDTVVANVVQQAAAVLIFLFVPKVLGVESYGQATYVVTLLSFMSFADFGLSFVYARKMPAVYGRDDPIEVIAWNSTVLRFRVYTSFLFALAICLVHLIRYGDILNSLFLLLIPPLSIFPSFYVARYTSQRNFAVLRDTNILQAVTRLAVLPGVVLAGLRGWFIGQLMGVLMVLGRSDLRVAIRSSWGTNVNINWGLVRAHLPEAVTLGLITTLWTQLLFSGRVFAAFIYPDAIVARYGLAGSAYQLVASLIISAFVPQTIKVYRMLEEDRTAAVHYTFGVIIKSLIIVVAMTGVGLVAAPIFFDFFFPKYQIDFSLWAPFILSLVNYPVIVSVGSLLVGALRSRLYLILIVFWLFMDWTTIQMITPYFGYHSAAIAQLFSLSLYAVSLLLVIAIVFRDVLRRRWPIWISISASAVAPMLLVGLLKSSRLASGLF